MFDIIPLTNRDTFFDRLDSRTERQSYFCRLVGFDDEQAFLRLLEKLYTRSQTNGVYIKSPISNPTEKDAEMFYRTVDSPYVYDRKHVRTDVRRLLAGIDADNAELLCDAVLEMLAEMRRSGAKDSILKNAYIKFLCWLRGVFEKAAYRTGEIPLPTILFEGDTGKYEVYVLRILARAGCDVFIVNYLSDDSYLKTDPDNTLSVPFYGQQRRLPSTDFTKLDPAALREADVLRRELNSLDCVVDMNSWLIGSFLESLEKTNSQRGGLTRKVNSLFIRYVGVDDRDLYRNRLFALTEDIPARGGTCTVIAQKIANPSIEEASSVTQIQYTGREDMAALLAAQLNVSKEPLQNQLLRRALVNAIEAEGGSLSRLYNYGVQMLCWIRRYGVSLYAAGDMEHQPVLLYYGGCTARERDFLYLLARAGVDVIVMMPDKQADAIFAGCAAGNDARVEELPASMPAEPFPDKEVKVRVATAAYHAERELDQILYTGTGLFRNRQFARSKPVTLKTTYEEALLLWKEEAKYRPYFDTEGGEVTVPNIFAKICGVKDGSLPQYFVTVRGMVTEDTFVLPQIPYLTGDSENPVRPFVRGFHSKGQIQPDLIKNHPSYQYDYLKEDTQDYMLEKMQELIELDWIQSKDAHFADTALAVLLNLDKQILQMIQNFDFTGEVPKLMAVDADESMFSLEDCVLISFLNLVGFDIAIFTPTGYRNIEKYIKRDVYEDYTIGEFVFNITVPNLKAGKRQENSTGLFGKLFGKGRN